MKKLSAFGYWKSEWEPELPHPEEYAGEGYEADVLVLLKSYLSNATLVLQAEGTSWCRFDCGEKDMGRCDYSDGTYLWPEGLIHYIQAHQVCLPEDFLQHIKEQKTPPKFEPTALAELEIDFEYGLKK